MIVDKLDLKVCGQDTAEVDQDNMAVDLPPNKDIELLKNLSLLLADVISNVDDDRYLTSSENSV